MIDRDVINTYSHLAKSGKFPDNTYLHRDLLKLVKSRIEDKDHLNILDVGSGAGYFGLSLAKIGHQVTMVDLSLFALSLARQKNLSVETLINFIAGDAETLPFKSDKFNAAVCIFVFSHLISPTKALSEIARILRKGGKALISFENKLWHVISAALDEDYKKALSLLLEDTPVIKAYDILPPVKLYSLSNIEMICHNSGLCINSVSGLRYLTAFQEILKDIGTTDAEKILLSNQSASDLEQALSDNTDFMQIARHFMVECTLN